MPDTIQSLQEALAAVEENNILKLQDLISEPNIISITPKILHAAIAKERVEIVKLLLQTHRCLKDIALHAAVTNNKLAMVQHILPSLTGIVEHDTLSKALDNDDIITALLQHNIKIAPSNDKKWQQIFEDFARQPLGVDIYARIRKLLHKINTINRQYAAFHANKILSTIISTQENHYNYDTKDILNILPYSDDASLHDKLLISMHNAYQKGRSPIDMLRIIEAFLELEVESAYLNDNISAFCHMILANEEMSIDVGKQNYIKLAEKLWHNIEPENINTIAGNVLWGAILGAHVELILKILHDYKDVMLPASLYKHETNCPSSLAIFFKKAIKANSTNKLTLIWDFLHKHDKIMQQQDLASLLCAAVEHNHTELVERINATLDKSDGSSFIYAIIIAVKNNNLNLLKILLYKKTFFLTQGSQENPLCVAVDTNNIAIAKILLEYIDNSVFKKTSLQKTLDTSAKINALTRADKLNRKDFFELILDQFRDNQAIKLLQEKSSSFSEEYLLLIEAHIEKYKLLQLAVAMGTHERLGQNSFIFRNNTDAFAKIVNVAFELRSPTCK